MFGRLPFLLLIAALLTAVQVPRASYTGQPTADGTQKPPIIRSATRAVNVSVLVTDHEGQLIQGLNQGDFEVFDNGRRENIAFFSTRSNKGPERYSGPSLPPGEYTNDPRRSGVADDGVTLILFDTVNTAYLSQTYSLGKIRIFLRQLQPQDHVGVYVLTASGLKVVLDPRQSAATLLEAMQSYDDAHKAAGGSKASAAAENSTGLLELDRFLRGKDERQPLNKCDPERLPITVAAFQEIVRSTAGFSGGKTVVWVTEHVPSWFDEDNAFDFFRVRGCGLPNDSNLVLEEPAVTKPLPDSRGAQWVGAGGSSPEGMTGLGPALAPGRNRRLNVFDELDLLLRLLTQNNVALYPVSAEGLQTVRLFGPGGMDSGAFISDPQTMTKAATGSVDAAADVASQQHMEELARRTGGRAYYNRNDLETGIRRALNDSKYGYELAYYPAHGRWNGDWRKIEVKVNRPGVTVLARGGYYAFPEPKLLPPKASKQLLEEIAASPLEDTEIPVTVKLTPPRGVSSRTVEARVYANAQTMFSNQLGQGWKSDFEVLFFQLTAKNKTLDVTTETVDLELTDAKYTKALKEGFDTVGTIQLKPGAALLYVIVHDKMTDAVGSVRIPLDQYSAAHPN